MSAVFCFVYNQLAHVLWCLDTGHVVVSGHCPYWSEVRMVTSRHLTGFHATCCYRCCFVLQNMHNVLFQNNILTALCLLSSITKLGKSI